MKKKKQKGEKALELFMALLDEFGCFIAPGANPRLELVSSLDEVIFLLKNIERNRNLKEEGVGFGPWLLKIENSLSKVRETAGAFLDSMHDEREEVAYLCRELELMSQDDVGLFEMSLFARSLTSSYRIQSETEELLVTGFVRNMEFFYKDCSEDRKGKLGQLKRAVNCLKRERIAHEIQSQEAVALLCRFKPSNDSSAKVFVDDNKSVCIKREGSRYRNSEAHCQIHYAGANSKILGGETFSEAFDSFLSLIAAKKNSADESKSYVTVLLVVGSEGCGKTHVCDELEKKVALLSTSSCSVIRPRLPLDFLGSSVGGTEDTIVSMFGAAAHRSSGNTLLILDDVENLLLASGQENDGRMASIQENHLKLRSQMTFFAALDSIRKSITSGSNLLVICTARNDIGSGRVDRTFYLEPPNDLERSQIITSHLKLGNSDANSTNECLLSDVVESTVGKSYAELTLICRRAIEDWDRIAKSNLPVDAHAGQLAALKDRLKSSTPESLRNGVIDDVVDMRVMSARDLLSSSPASSEGNKTYKLPLLGKSASSAWKALEASILVPLCRARSLHRLLDCTGKSSPKRFAGGILLVGDPGCGKTEIAYHCAKAAAGLLPSVKLLDVNCTSLICKEVGQSEQAVHSLFDSARKASPCILLLEGIENIAAVRGNDSTTEGTLDRVLSTLLVELDGVDEKQHCSEQGIAVIGITLNAKWIDPALKRPGRLEKTIKMEQDW